MGTEELAPFNVRPTSQATRVEEMRGDAVDNAYQQ
jgi:hypothetical protein